MRWKTLTVVTTMLAAALACGGGGGDWDTEAWNDLSDLADPSGEVLNPTTVVGGAPGIENLAGTRILITTPTETPPRDYCKILGDAGLVVECGYGIGATEENSNVMLKCGTLPDETTKWLMGALELDELVQWDWRTDPDYGVGYCNEPDAISMEIVAP